MISPFSFMSFLILNYFLLKFYFWWTLTLAPISFINVMSYFIWSWEFEKIFSACFSASLLWGLFHKRTSGCLLFDIFYLRSFATALRKADPCIWRAYSPLDWTSYYQSYTFYYILISLKVYFLWAFRNIINLILLCKLIKLWHKIFSSFESRSIYF